MKIKVKIIFAFIIPFNLYAYSLLHNCQRQGYEFANGSGNDYISKKCFYLFKNSANLYSYIKSENIEIFGMKNILYVGKIKSGKIDWQIISGANSKLEDIFAIAYDEKENEIFVYDKSKRAVFVYDANLPGNILPRRELKTPLLKEISEIKIDNKHKQIVLLNKKKGLLLFYSSDANINQKIGKRKDRLLRKIKVKKFANNLQLNLKDNLIYLNNKRQSLRFKYKILPKYR